MPGQLVQQTWMSNPVLYAPARHKRACRYASFVPDPLADIEFVLTPAVLGLISEAERNIELLNESRDPALDPLARLLLRTESIASSRVEGLQLGVQSLARAEARVEHGAHISGTAREVLSNINAMQLAIESAASARTFGIKHIIAIHRRLLDREHPKIAGRLRSQQNWIGGNDYTPCGADFVPPPPNHVEPLLTDLCDAVNSDLLPPLVQAALVHAQFETIHPFDDGNGRTGRALVHVVLRRRKLAPRYLPPVSILLANARERYVTGLTSFRGSDVAEWIEYFAAAMAGAAHLGLQFRKAVEALVVRWENRLAAMPSAPRAGATAWSIISVLPAHPVITASIAAEATGRATSRVYEALVQLEEAGVLVPLSKRPLKVRSEESASRRKQAWEAAGLLELIEEVETGVVRKRR